MRKIPATMATQHPDNAQAPYWGTSPFISTGEEVEEAYRCFADLGIDEYMWDWEGKFVDEAVVDRLLNHYLPYFRKNQLGRDKFLTFRIPNIWKEKAHHRLARSYMGILTAAHTARDYKVHCPPIFEVILPMTTSPDQLIAIHERYHHAFQYERMVFGAPATKKPFLEVIPLIEGSVTLLQSGEILATYLKKIQKLYRQKISTIRPFIARSDPALDSGYIPALLGAKGALSEYYRFEEKSGVRVFPIIGVGSLPFRGGLNPDNLESFMELYAGVRTVTIQSAFRYDYPLDKVKRAIRTLKEKLPRRRAVIVDPKILQRMVQIAQLFAAEYQPVIENLAGTINQLSPFIPQHRERILHTGHFGYSRKIGRSKKSLPRAITFTATLASLGIPPSLIGTGRGLKKALKERHGPLLDRLFPSLPQELQEVGGYLNRENLEFLSRKDPAWQFIKKDVSFLESYLGTRMEPKTTDQYTHRNMTSNIYHLWRAERDPRLLAEEILRAARVRRSLG
ncbi:MAG: phosphoenolpyruvate carboxylase [Deltaproteobacteria bacterium]|nr:phosphoenolpyruvate carboxylase [Deltaproteobacteria bacterium]